MEYEKDQKPHPDDYHFINETIKKRPFGTRRTRRAFFAAAGCVLALCAGAAVATGDKWTEKLRAKKQVVEDALENRSAEAETDETEGRTVREVLVKIPDSERQKDISGGAIREFWDENAIIFLNNDADLYILTTKKDLPTGMKVSVTMADGPVLDGQTEGVDEETGRRVIRIPSETMAPELAEALSHKAKFRYLGIFGTDISDARAKESGLPQGVYVDRVDNQSPAMLAGLQSGDILQMMNGTELEDMEEYMEELQSLEKNDIVRAALSRRNGEGEYEEMNLIMTVEEK